jgi:GNAT superfamily N-acetyltransferase
LDCWPDEHLGAKGCCNRQRQTFNFGGKYATDDSEMRNPNLEIKVDPFPSDLDINPLWLAAWGSPLPPRFADILSRSLGHLGAYEREKIIGFVNIAWDGGIHAFVLDTCVHPDFRRKGIATRLIREAETLARQRGAHWLHVDFEPHLEEFYRGCGFRSTAAGLIELQQSQETNSREPGS